MIGIVILDTVILGTLYNIYMHIYIAKRFIHLAKNAFLLSISIRVRLLISTLKIVVKHLVVYP